MDRLEYARSTVQQQIEALQLVHDQLGDEFLRAVDALYGCRGRVIVSGVGKAGIIGMKISATLASTGTASYWMHAVEARHGDLGRVLPEDVVLALSNSGETEVVQLVPSIKKLNATIVAITGNAESTLARYSDIVLDIGRVREACPLGLAPSCSTTAMLVMGDALALTVFRMRDWQPEDYAFYHPGGELGRKLIRVREVMRTGAANPVVQQDITVQEALRTMSGRNSPGAASVVDADGALVGFFTDGDLRRHLIDGSADMLSRPVSGVMTRGPKSIGPEDLAAEAFRMLRQFRIDQVPVVDEQGRPVGLLDVQDWLDIERGSDHLDPPENDR
jgi:arabinose-5-phosphate isomerase